MEEFSLFIEERKEEKEEMGMGTLTRVSTTYKPHFDQKLHDLFQLKLLCFVYESVHKISPMCFHNFFKSLESVHQYGTRQAGKDDIFLTRKNTSQCGL